MKEESVFFNAGHLKIEGKYADSGSEKGVVIAHPHPQMGGSMWNNVVETMVASFFSKGYSTLRFNFRGVGRSEGHFDNGIGEQEDILAAAEYLVSKNKEEIVLAGYSFGAWITVKVAGQHKGFRDIILVSPAVDFFEFDFSECDGKIGLMTCGDEDPFASIDFLSSLADQVHAQLETVKGADHFYVGQEKALATILDKYLT